MAERKTLRLSTLKGNDGFFTLSTDRDFSRSCSEKGGPRCIRNKYGYSCASCTLSEKDATRILTWLREEGYESDAIIKDKPYQLEIIANKEKKVADISVIESVYYRWHSGIIFSGTSKQISSH